ncbi:hypothetical protein ACLBXJ_15610 [Methylobacterium mesophilicum]
MPRYNLAPIVRPSDLRASTPSHVAEAIRAGTARLVGFESQGDALRLLEARERTRRPYVPTDTARAEPGTRWASLADIVDPYAYRGA